MATRHSGSSKPEVTQVFGGLAKVDPKSLAVTPQMIAHVTNAKALLSRRPERVHASNYIDQLEHRGLSIAHGS